MLTLTMVLYWAIASGVLASLIWIFISRSPRKVPGEIPGPQSDDEKEGHLPQMRQAETFYSYVTELHEKYGPIVGFYMGTQYVVSIASPELFQQHSKLFDRPAVIFKPLEDLITASSIQFTNGEEGRRRHGLYSHYFSGTAKFYPDFVACVDKASARLAVQADGYQPISLRDAMFKLTSAVMSKCAFDNCFTETELEELVSMYSQWADGVEKTFKGAKSESEPSDEFSYTTKMRQLVEGMLSRQQLKGDSNRGSSYVDILLNDGTLTAEGKFADAVTMLIGGIHTSAYLLTWAIYSLARDKQIQDRLVSELETYLPEPLRSVDPEDIEKLRYLRQVINESLRLPGVATFSARVCDEPIELDGYKIPAETPVLHALAYILQNEEYYPGASRFDPNHFTPENVRERHPFAFKPFGFAGNRMCPGNKFALQEASVALAMLLTRYEFNLVGDQEAVPHYGFVVRPRDEILITLRPRNHGD